MKKKLFFPAVLLFFVFFLMGISALAQEPTIPTRTPTPGPQTPVAASPTPGNPGNPPGNPGNPPGNPPAATNTPTPLPLPPTPIGGYLPTAVPCSNQPTILALNPNFINVRSGPGTDYAIVGSLVYQEVRLIIGRDAYASWWLIQLSNGQPGWVADEVVLVQGSTVTAPIVAAPLLNGVTVTPGAPWQPTPPPQCPTPVTAVTSTPTPTPTTSEQTVIVAPLDTNTAESYPAATPEPTTQTSVLSAAVTPTPTATAITLPTSIAAVPQPTGAAPSPAVENTVDPTGPDLSGLLLVGAALLLVTGTAVFIIKRR